MKINVGDKVIITNAEELADLGIAVGSEVEVTKVENFHTGKRGRPMKLFTCVLEDKVFEITSNKVAKAK